MNKPIAFTMLAATASIAGVAAVATSTDSEAPLPLDRPAECIECGYAGAIFAPGTDPAIVEMVSQAIMNVDSSRFQVTNRWPGASGTPVDLTYSFPSDGLSIPNGVGEGTNNNTIHATMNARFGSEAVWKAKFAEVFDMWEEFTGNTYTEVSDDDAPFFSSPGPLHGSSGRGDIRIAAKPMDGSFGVLAYNFFPGSTGGEMVLDNAENWGNSSANFRFFRNTIAHEHGHGLGILHVCPIQQTKLMEPFLTTAFDGPQHDDIRAVTNHYGDINEPNENTGEATFLGNFNSVGGAFHENLSIRNGSDDDYFSFTVSNSAVVDISADPFGFSYSSGPQTQACNTGTVLNSNTQVDPAITVYDTDGTTIIVNNDLQPAGSTETANNVVIPAAGTYFFKIDSTLAFTGNNQIYDMSFSVTVDEDLGCVADINGDGITDASDLGILINSFGTAVAPNTNGDLNGDGFVDASDLGILIGVFGTCTPV